MSAHVESYQQQALTAALEDKIRLDRMCRELTETLKVTRKALDEALLDNKRLKAELQIVGDKTGVHPRMAHLLTRLKDAIGRLEAGE